MFLSARILGPSHHGIFSAAISWASIIVQLVCLSFPQVLPFFIQSSGKSLQGRLAIMLLKWAFIQSLIGGTFFFLLKFSGRIYGLEVTPVITSIIFAFFVPSLLFDEYIRAICVNAQLLDVYNKSLVWGKTIAIFVLVVLIGLKGASLTGFAFVYLLSFLIPVCFVLFAMRRKFNTGLRQEDPLGFFLHHGIRLYPNTLGSQILSNNGAIVGSFFLTTKEIGWYQLGMQIVSLTSLLPQAFASVMFGQMSLSTPAGIWEQQKRYLLFILLPITIFAALGSKYGGGLVTFFFGQSWQAGAGVVVSVFPVAISIAFAQAMTPQWLGRGLFKTTSIVTCIIAVSNLLLNLLLVPSLGVQALVVSAWICLGLLTFIFQSAFFLYCNKNISRAI